MDIANIPFVPCRPHRARREVGCPDCRMAAGLRPLVVRHCWNCGEMLREYPLRHDPRRFCCDICERMWRAAHSETPNEVEDRETAVLRGGTKEAT